MTGVIYRFEGFHLDVLERRLWREGQPLELQSRYFDALVLLVREQGNLVEKDRFFEEVWSGMVVSDSALTQCIKEIRKQLGDDAVRPRFIQTVPKYGYRFVAPVDVVDPQPIAPHEEIVSPDTQAISRPSYTHSSGDRSNLHLAVAEGAGGTLGGGVAGAFGGLLYGLAMTQAGHGVTVGVASTLLVMLGLGALIGLAGGLGVSGGMALAQFVSGREQWSIVGAALGGTVMGGVGHLLGVDAFNLLLGRTPASITGAFEGAVLGTALALGARMGGGSIANSPWRPAIAAGFTGAIVGVLIPLVGGRLFAGSLRSLVDAFPGSHLQLHALGALFRDPQFGLLSQSILGGVEILLFGLCVVAGTILGPQLLNGRSVVTPRAA